MEKVIQNLKQIYITLEELEEIIKPKNYTELVDKINTLKNNGIIVPIKNRKNKNGKIPSLFIKYKIIKDKEQIEEIEKEIKHLSPELKIEKYLKNKEIYIKQRKDIQKLDNFLKNRKEKLNIKISKNERAYQIWGYEKMLDTPIGKNIINFNELQEKLNYYLTPEPFFDFILEQKEKMIILIIENKDTWYTLRKIFKDNNLKTSKILGIQIDGLIYGEGNKITKEQAIQNYEKEILSANIKFIYWGDLDFTGIDMYERVKKANPQSNIKLFTKIYERMLELAENREIEKIHKEQNKNINLKSFVENFEDIKIQTKIQDILTENKYIPQEILNYEEIEKIVQK